MTAHAPIDALVLAAGRAARFGVPKVLLPAGPGHTLLSRVLTTASRAVDGRVVVVLGREAALTRAEVKRWAEQDTSASGRVVVAENPRYEAGLSTSLRCGLESVTTSSAGVLVLLGDQPAVEPLAARRLVGAFQRRRMGTLAVVAAQGGAPRNPVLLSRELFPELLRVTGDRGARDVLRAHRARVEQLEWGTGPWFTDVDDWSAYAKLARVQGWHGGGTLPLLQKPELMGRLGALEACQEASLPPMLAPGWLLVALEPELYPAYWACPRVATRRTLECAGGLGLEGAVFGNGATPEATLKLLRRAALWMLGWVPEHR